MKDTIASTKIVKSKNQDFEWKHSRKIIVIKARILQYKKKWKPSQSPDAGFDHSFSIDFWNQTSIADQKKGGDQNKNTDGRIMINKINTADKK